MSSYLMIDGTVVSYSRHGMVQLTVSSWLEANPLTNIHPLLAITSSWSTLSTILSRLLSCLCHTVKKNLKYNLKHPNSKPTSKLQEGFLHSTRLLQSCRLSWNISGQPLSGQDRNIKLLNFVLWFFSQNAAFWGPKQSAAAAATATTTSATTTWYFSGSTWKLPQSLGSFRSWIWTTLAGNQYYSAPSCWSTATSTIITRTFQLGSLTVIKHWQELEQVFQTWTWTSSVQV